MRRPDNSLPASITLVCGSTGSGKSHQVKRAISEARDVFVFDAKNEYGQLRGFKVAGTRADLVKGARTGGRWSFPACTVDDFDFFCRVVWARGGCLVVVEELSAVTQPGRASGAWHLICTQGRGYGLQVIAITQRPAESDKTVIGNASTIRCHRLTRAGDRAYMAAELDVSRDQVDALSGFDYLEKHPATGQPAERKNAGKTVGRKR